MTVTTRFINSMKSNLNQIQVDACPCQVGISQMKGNGHTLKQSFLVLASAWYRDYMASYKSTFNTLFNISIII